MGDLLPKATSQFSRLLEKGKTAAVSWGNEELTERLLKKKKEFQSLVERSSIEQWQTNTAIHFNAWANLQREDFEEVASAYENLIGAFFCPRAECGGIYYVVPERGSREVLRCDCGDMNINLKRK